MVSSSPAVTLLLALNIRDLMRKLKHIRVERWNAVQAQAAGTNGNTVRDIPSRLIKAAK